MSNTKIAVIYYSSTGGNTQMARWAADAAKEAGAEVRLLKAHELAPTLLLIQILYGVKMLMKRLIFLKQQALI